MKRLLKKAIKFAWKAYVFLCVLLITGYILLMAIFLISRQFDIVELPNGTYMKRRHFFASAYGDIVLRAPDGRLLVNESIDFVCFNDIFVYGYTYGPEHGRFIYEKGQGEAILGDDPRYDETLERSGLSTRWGCGGHERAMLGFGILIKDPKYRSWRPFD